MDCGLIHYQNSVGDTPILHLHENFRHGVVRRSAIKDWFESNPTGRLAINRKYQPQLKYDPDLRKLVKFGYLKQIRRRTGIMQSGQTFLVKG